MTDHTPDDWPDDGHDDRETSDGRETPDGRVYARRRLAVGAVVLCVVVLVATVLSRGSDEAPPPVAPGAIRIDAWAPYWAFDRSIPDLTAHGEILHEVSPFVWIATGADEVGLDPSADRDRVDEFVETARDQGIAVVPAILDRMPAGGMAGVLADPTTRRQHVSTIVNLARSLDADGIDIDYEQFAFADDRSTWPATRENFATFIEELAAALDEDGRTLTVSIPPVYDAGTTAESGYWVYDYGRLARAVDRIRIMAYDYSGIESGPISPLAWVREVIAGTAEAAGGTDKLVLGIPLYGNNVPLSTVGECPEGEEIGRTAVTIRTVDELVERRGATPVADPVLGEWSFTYDLVIDDGVTSCTQTRQVNYVDSDGARARIDLAREAGFAGVSLWALGYEDDSFWDLAEPVALRPDR